MHGILCSIRLNYEKAGIRLWENLHTIGFFFIITVWLIYNLFHVSRQGKLWKAVLRECGKEHISFL